MHCSVLRSHFNITVAITYGRLDLTSKQHGSASDRVYWRRGHRNNPAVYAWQLCVCLWLSRVLALDWILEKYFWLSKHQGDVDQSHYFATQFLQTYLFSINRKDISTLSISINASNCFHLYESNTLSFLFSITQLPNLQYKQKNQTLSLLDLLKTLKSKYMTIFIFSIVWYLLQEYYDQSQGV